MYDSSFFFVPNALDRYDLGQRNRFERSIYGSVQHSYPVRVGRGRNGVQSWLPAPKGKFNLVLRIYDPSETPPSILNGSWLPPAVNRRQ